MSKHAVSPDASATSRAAARPQAPISWSRRDAVSLGGLLLLASLAWCSAYSKWIVPNWSTPFRYLEPECADFIGSCALVKTMVYEDWLPLGTKPAPRLGAPSGADWSPVPTTDEIELFVVALCVRFFGLFAGFNLGVLLGHLSAAAVCYAVARRIGIASHWAFVAALAFGLAPYLFAQSPHHLTCQYVFYVPLYVLVWRWVAGDEELALGSGRFWVAAAIAFLSGTENPYFTNVLCQLTLLGGAVRAWQARSRAPLIAAGAVVAAAAAGFVFINLETWIYRLFHDAGAAGTILSREYKWMDIYGLKLVDLFIPSVTHHSEALARFGLAHRQASPLLDEEGCTYLGILGGACLLWLAATAVRALVERRQEDVPAAAWQVLWIVLMFTTGGINAIIASFTGFTLFRTACRYSVVILLLVLLWAAQRLTAWERNTAKKMAPDTLRIAVLTLAASLCLLVLWDQVPRAPTVEQTRAIALQVDSDRGFVGKMEGFLPAGGMVFQLPVMEYSGQAIPGVPPYDHFRPYLYSKDLKFSFGALPGDPRNAWQMQVQQLLVDGAAIDQQRQLIRFKPDNVRAAIERIRKEGFAALYVNRNGFPDRGKGLFDTLLELGYEKPPIYSAAGDMACIVFGDQPAAGK